MKGKTEEIVLLSHGGGGSRTEDLLRRVIAPWLSNPILDSFDDAACFSMGTPDVVMTTDSYVVRPLFFPGGDIGRLAVCGTINDLAMQGAEPKYMSLGLIIEEGLPVLSLERIMRSIAETLNETGVLVVTGDTKVVERGAGSGIYINTTGLGVRRGGVDTHIRNAKPGDAVILSGTMGDHGVAVMSVREGLRFDTALVSDVAPLADMVRTILEVAPRIHCLRDPTRGGVAAALNDMARASSVCVRIREQAIPIRAEVRGACDLLGLDPLNVANEGKAVIVCAAEDAGRVLDVLRAHPLGGDAQQIGEVVAAPSGRVLLATAMGGERLVDVPVGEDLPRIC